MEQLNTQWFVDLTSNSFHTAECYNNSFQVPESGSKCIELQYVNQIRSLIKYAW